jgi:hypothetical protein
MTIEGIVNAKALVEVYGYWPSFHDAVILRLALDRGGVMGPEMTVQYDLWEPNPEHQEHMLVTLVFRGIKSFILAEFNVENMIDEMEIIPIAHPREDNCRFSVRFNSFYPPDSGLALEMDFQCREIEVANVAPRDTSTSPCFRVFLKPDKMT